MRNDPDSPTLFDNEEEVKQKGLKKIALQSAAMIYSQRRVSQAAINNLAMGLMEWCHDCDLKGDHWSPEQQMAWLVRRVRDQYATPPSCKALREIVMNEFFPNELRLRDGERNIEEWKAKSTCKLCVDSGKLLPGEQARLRAPDEFCTCAAGEARREEARREDLRQ